MLENKHIKQLKAILDGVIFTDNLSKTIYSTDASVYSEKPSAIIIPKDTEDIKKTVSYAALNKLPLIPRAAGTSLAGQVVGKGIVVDISKNLTQIKELNTDEKWVKVEPGVILDNLNQYLSPYGLFFGPEASTANRCTIGGMAGNNACGLHAVVYGTTREHIIEVSGYLSDGSFVTFKPLSVDEFNEKCKLKNLEGKIYLWLKSVLSDKKNQKQINENYPDKRLIRRNNGYALDLLLRTNVFSGNQEKINVSKLIAGSEGTLLFISELKLNLVEKPPSEKALICVHFNNINQALKANIIALKHSVTAVELMDDIILNASENNSEQQKNRFFVKGKPKAILLIEVVKNTLQETESIAKKLITDLKELELGYHYPIIFGEDTKKVWNLRKAGLGIMANIRSDKKSVTVIEDTAVHTDILPEYIEEFTQIMESYGEDCVYHAHAGTGEIHLRPRLDLKQKADIKKFENIAWDIAKLVKKHKGSLSGEHGDGRLRGKFIPFMLGEDVYNLLVDLKKTWDPNNIFNPNKIIDCPPISDNLRYKQGSTKNIQTIFDFSDKGGIIRAAESCNGSGDCRKSALAGGTMCPSYMATKDEKHVTRARANALRSFLTQSNKKNPFNHKELYEVLDLCLSCKACKSECPSSVDIAKLKAEFLQHYYKSNGIPLRTRAIANITKINSLGALMPQATNFLLKNKFTSGVLKLVLGFSEYRSIPLLQKNTLSKWYKKNAEYPAKEKGAIVLFLDEFTNFNDTHTGITAIRLLTKLGYRVKVVKHRESGRTYLSKGLIKKAKKIAELNVSKLNIYVSKDCPLVGIEPSAILSFRDEYPELVNNKLKNAAKNLAENSLTIEEFLANEIEKGNIGTELFTNEKRHIKLHGHCQQKAVSSTEPTKKVLSLPKNYSVEEIKSGCCGMAGSFGYEKEHYNISMKIGELILFPEVRKSSENTVISASGTSCRHQIFDGTGRKALHPVEVLFDALNPKA